MTAKSRFVVLMAAICLMALALGLTGYAFAVDGTADSSGAQYGPLPTDPVPPTTDPVPPADTGGTGDTTTPPADTGGAAGDQYGPPPIPPTTDPLPPADTGDDESDDGSALPPADDDSGDDGDVSYRNHGEHVSDVARDHDAHASRDLPNGNVSDNHGHAVSQAAHDHSGEPEHGQASHGEHGHER